MAFADRVTRRFGPLVGRHKVAVTSDDDQLIGWDDLAVGAPGDAAVNVVPPSIRGTAVVGAKLKADRGTWSVARKVKLTYSYQWNLDGQPIRKATSASYRVQPGDVGKELTVTVTVRAKRLQPVSATSAPVTVTGKPDKPGKPGKPTEPGKPTDPGKPGKPKG